MRNAAAGAAGGSRVSRSEIAKIVAGAANGVGRLAAAVLALAAVCAPLSAHAADMDAAKAKALVGRNACMGCHAATRKLVGPSWQDIQAKYKTDPDAETKLTGKVLKGGAGVWGMIPMPSHPGLSDADAQTIVTWILAGAPAAK